MRRREFITLLGGTVVAWPLAARARQERQVRIGFLATASPGAAGAVVSAFRDGLRERGYVEGQNLTIDFRSIDGSPEQNASVAAELVRSNVDVILAWTTPSGWRICVALDCPELFEIDPEWFKGARCGRR